MPKVIYNGNGNTGGTALRYLELHGQEQRERFAAALLVAGETIVR